MTKQEFITTIYANETQFTAAVNKYINHNYPELRQMYFHIANESATSAAMRIKLHSMGVLAGVPDFCILLPYVWFLELKYGNGKLSDKQKHLHQLWKSKGIIVETAYNAEDVITLIDRSLTKL